MGIKAGDKIAMITSNNRSEWSIMDVGLLTLGAVNVPLYPTISSKDYEYIKLNDKIKDNLMSINDYILIQDNESFNYIILCEIKFDKEMFNNININKKINKIESGDF